ncbi:response regulator [Leptolyngbya sp. AN02str]|uniref:response regulator transcription factor n=1 Tax=Leptolyngbya sp. AN02str TaxID=3423363 RepID=UPI003D31E1D0
MTKILVIEDETLLRENTIELLELEGFQAISAENGVVGVQLAQKFKPDLIICDVMMPELDGFGVLHQLRQNSATATIPFIFLTAKTERADIREGMDLGADDYLAKPYEANELLKAIATRLEKHTNLMQQYQTERRRAEVLGKEVHDLQQFMTTQEDFLNNFVQELKNPLSNINMAICMIKDAKTDHDRNRYLQILRDECDREINLLNQIEELKNLLTPENSKLLRQLNLLKK